MARIDDVITYLEMFERPGGPRPPTPAGKLALIRAEDCTVSFYRYLYETVGTPWLWFERRLLSDARLAAEINRPMTEIFVLYVGGVPAGYFELNAEPRETELNYFGLIPEFIGRGLGPFLLQAAIDRAWSRPIERFWVHTCTFDHPRALPLYQRLGFVVYARRDASFEDPRLTGVLPRTLVHPRLPPLKDFTPRGRAPGMGGREGRRSGRGSAPAKT
jgi:GNAT superfamily N-acetyltransferase